MGRARGNYHRGQWESRPGRPVGTVGQVEPLVTTSDKPIAHSVPGCQHEKKRTDKITKFQNIPTASWKNHSSPVLFICPVGGFLGGIGPHSPTIPHHLKWRGARLQGAVGVEINWTALQPFLNQVLIVSRH